MQHVVFSGCGLVVARSLGASTFVLLLTSWRAPLTNSTALCLLLMQHGQLLQYFKRPWIISQLVEPLWTCHKNGHVPLELVVNVDHPSESMGRCFCRAHDCACYADVHEVIMPGSLTCFSLAFPPVPMPRRRCRGLGGVGPEDQRLCGACLQRES